MNDSQKTELRTSHKGRDTVMSPIPEDKLKISANVRVAAQNKRMGSYAGPYRLLETLGKGGLATVKVGVDFTSGTKVAVKIVEKEKLANPREQVSMAREITIMKLLKHKNVLRLYDIYENDEKIFLILDLFEGGDLYGHLTTHGAMRPSEAIILFRQIIEGVEFCHKNLIVHRDLKPENLLLSGDKKQLVLSDFGLSTGMAGSRNLLKTRCGTVHYISPEVAKGDPYIGMASDVWSCGIILFAMVTATLPFDGDTSIAVLKKIVKGDYTMPAYLPEELQDLIRKMLDLSPEKRVTIPQIKQHPWYRLGADKDEIVMDTDEDAATIPPPEELEENKNILDNLLLLGWEIQDLKEQLQAPESNLAKVFYRLLVQHKHNPQRPGVPGQGVTSPGRRRSASIDNGNASQIIVRRNPPERNEDGFDKVDIDAEEGVAPLKAPERPVRKERKIVRKDDPLSEVSQKARSRRAATIGDGTRPEVSIEKRLPWGISPSRDPNAKMYTVESRKSIDQILENLKNCFGGLQLDVTTEKRTKTGAVKIKARVRDSGKRKGKTKIVKAEIRPSEDGAANVVHFKKGSSKKEAKEDFQEVVKKIEETLVV